MTCTPTYLFYLLSVRPVTPTLTRSPSEATIESGTGVTLTCATASVGGTATYTFRQDGTPVQSNAGATYNLASSATTDSGDYTCTAIISSVESQASTIDTLTIVSEY